MALSIISWNINNSSYHDIKSYVEEILDNYEIDLFVFFEGVNLADTCLVYKGFDKVNLINPDNSKKAIRAFRKSSLDYTIKNSSSYSEVLSKDIKSTKINSDTQSYIIDQVKFIRRVERISTLETFSISNNTSKEKFLFAAVHFPSKLYHDDFDQMQSAITYKSNILGKAKGFNNNIVVCGDFNMNPFDRGMTEPMGFFTFNNSDQAKPNYELIFGRQLSFYNPCWRLLGDYNIKTGKNKVAGSFFYSNSRTRKSKTWHLIDQVIITKKMLSSFDQDSLQIIETKDLIRDLFLKGKKIDHLPLYFSLTI